MSDTLDLDHNPFPRTPEERDLFWATPQRKALVLLRQGILDGRGLLLLLGPDGTGKTTLVTYLATQLLERAPVCFLWQPLDPGELVNKICRDFGVPETGPGRLDNMEALRRFSITRCLEEFPSPVIIVDNADDLPTRTLEEIRLLNNIETDTKKAIQILLCGQDRLEARLLRDDLRQLRQRVGTIARLDALNYEDTVSYIDDRLKKAGREKHGLMTREATYLLWKQTDGVLTRLHRIAGQALELAEVTGAPRANLPLIRRVLDETPMGPETLPGRTVAERNSHTFTRR